MEKKKIVFQAAKLWIYPKQAENVLESSAM
jgi:hypothetical protein